MSASDTDETLKLISIACGLSPMAYGVAIHPDRFEYLLTVWDTWYDANIIDTKGAERHPPWLKSK